MLIRFGIIFFVCFPPMVCVNAYGTEHEKSVQSVDKKTEAPNSSAVNPDFLYGSSDFYGRDAIAYKAYMDGKKIQFKRLTAYEPWPMPESPTWKENPYKDKSWLLYYHALEWLYAPADAYDKTKDPKYLQEMTDYLFSWLSANSPGKTASSMSWNDHAVASRTELIVYLYHKYLKDKITNEQRQILLSSLKRHGRILHGYLSNPRYRGHNHNLIHALALYDLGAAFPEMPNASQWKHAARKRINQLLFEMVEITEGVSKEQSAGYHYLAVRLFYEAHKYLCNFNDGFKYDQLQILRKMCEFASIMMYPDGKLPAIGDTNLGYDKGRELLTKLVSDGLATPTTEFILSNGEKGSRSADSFIYPKTGYAIFRPFNRNNRWEDRLFLAFDFGPPIFSHGHQDALSMTLYAYGKELLIDPGGPYSYSKKGIKHEFLIAKSHNIVVVDGLEYNRSQTFLSRYEDTQEFSFIEAAHQKYPGITYKRAIILIKPELVVVFDSLSSADNKNHFYDLHYHFAPDTTITQNWNGIEVLAENKTRLSLAVVGSSQIKKMTVKGQEKPFQGWATTKHDTKVPIPVAIFRQTERNCWFVSAMKPFKDSSQRPLSLSAKYDMQNYEVTIEDNGTRWSIQLYETSIPLITKSIASQN